MAITEENQERIILESLQGKLDEAEAAELKLWLEASAAHRQTYEFVKQLATRALLLKDLEKLDKAEGWKEIGAQIRLRRNRRLRIRWSKYAAAVLLPLFACAGAYVLIHRPEEKLPEARLSFENIRPGSRQAVLYLADGNEVDLKAWQDTVIRDGKSAREIGFRENLLDYREKGAPAGKTEQVVYNKIVVPRGGEYRLILSDGTRVWLNAGTEMEYPVNFSDSVREVVLKGEAYFEVTKDKNRRFQVVMDGATVEVLGTSFNASCYPGEHTCSATLESGRIDFRTGQGKQAVQVGENAVYDKQTGKITVGPVDLKYYTSWRLGKFYFHDTPLEEISRQLSRWYDVDFVFDDEALKVTCFSGVALRDKPIRFILNLLESTDFVEFILGPDGKIRIRQK